MSNSLRAPKSHFSNSLNSVKKADFKEAQVGKDPEKAHKKKIPTAKTEVGKKQTNNQAIYTMKHIVSRMSSYFPNRWPLSYLNLTKTMKTHIRRQQHKKMF